MFSCLYVWSIVETHFCMCFMVVCPFAPAVSCWINSDCFLCNDSSTANWTMWAFCTTCFGASRCNSFVSDYCIFMSWCWVIVYCCILECFNLIYICTIFKLLFWICIEHISQRGTAIKCIKNLSVFCTNLYCFQLAKNYNLLEWCTSNKCGIIDALYGANYSSRDNYTFKAWTISECLFAKCCERWRNIYVLEACTSIEYCTAKVSDLVASKCNSMQWRAIHECTISNPRHICRDFDCCQLFTTTERIVTNRCKLTALFKCHCWKAGIHLWRHAECLFANGNDTCGDFNTCQSCAIWKCTFINYLKLTIFLEIDVCETTTSRKCKLANRLDTCRNC